MVRTPFWSVLVIWLFPACVLHPVTAHAVPEATIAASDDLPARRFEPGAERNRRPLLRVPPKPAMAACEGKNEGDPCEFVSMQGRLEGRCMAGVENIFACRPFRNEQRPVVPQNSSPEQQAESRTASQHELKPSGKTENAQVRPIRPPSAQVQDVQPRPVPQPSETTEQQSSVSPAIPGRAYESWNLFGGNLVTYLFVALLASGLTWFGFFRHATIPLRRLRKVTQQLAKGDLSARVGEGLVHRKDEVADLARDVDRMAERIESLVGAHQRLVRDVSHELRSPLARLNVALELARQSAGPSLAAPFDRIDRESERLNELISQLLMLTKLENEGAMQQRTEIDITALIAEIAHDVDFEVRNKDRRVIAVAAEPLVLLANRELLRQALENLVRNAARYTAAGTAVEISLRVRESSGRSWAHIEVKDQGPGVPDSELYDIFRPFYRVNDARERQSGGTGVGLAISDRAVRLHGGSLRAFNAVGGGLIMEMELPLS